MKIHIENIGMLDEAEFEVGDLTLICGENNTGKTYATYSLYGYLDYINNTLGYSFYNSIADIINNYDSSIDVHDCKMNIKIIDIKNILNALFLSLEKNYCSNLLEILAGKEEDFRDSIFQDKLLLRISTFVQNIYHEKKQKIVDDFFKSSNVFELYKIDCQVIVFDYEKSKQYFTDKMQKDIKTKKRQFCLVLISYIFDKIYPTPFILSAERTGATMFQKELDVNKNEIVERISRASRKNVEKTFFNVLQARYSRYPKPVKDNIYFMRELDETAKKISFIKKGEKENLLYKEIIDLLYQVVGGKYVVSPEGIEFAPGAKQRITKGKFLVQRASSSVRSLLMLNYYILHRAQKGDILMIDEPELNLHPKNQIFIARLLGLLVNAGIKVFITTHSDYIVRELSNCIMLNNLTDEQIKKFAKQGYSEKYVLESKKVKAYLAEKTTEGKNTLRKVLVTQKQGIFMDTFDDPINSQNKNQGLIFEEIIKGTNDGR